MRMPATKENLEQFPDHSALPGSPLLKGLPGIIQLDSVLARKVRGETQMGRLVVEWEQRKWLMNQGLHVPDFKTR